MDRIGNEKIRGIHRQQDDIISLLIKMGVGGGDTQADSKVTSQASFYFCKVRVGLKRKNVPTIFYQRICF
jgi:hypothetical protein